MPWNYAAGAEWNPVIQTYCEKHQISAKLTSESHIDLLIENVAIELKAEDLHSSLFKKGGIAGNLEWELQQYYLPLRASKQIEEIWICVMLADNTSWRDLETLQSVVFPHRIPVKYYESRETAIKDIDTLLHSRKLPIDLHCPPYINISYPIPTLFKMLRIFPGMTEEWIKEYTSRYIAAFQEEIIPSEFFEWFIEECRFAQTNLERIWYDWWNSGVEPKENLLS